MMYRMENASLNKRADAFIDLMRDMDPDIIDDLVNEVSKLETKLADTIDVYDTQIKHLEYQIADYDTTINRLSFQLANSIKEQSHLLELINQLRK